MEHLSLYQLSRGTTPEQGVFYESQKLMDGLTQAETAQLTMDYMANPTAFDETVRWRNKNIDQLECLSGSFAALLASQNDHAQRKQSYDKLLEWAVEPDETTQIALRAASVQVLNSREALRDATESFHKFGAAITGSLGDHFANRVIGAEQTIINGRTYQFIDEALTFATQEGRHQRVTFFGFESLAGSAYSRFLQDNYTKANAEANTLSPGKRFARIANNDDWQHLLDGLNLMAQF